MAQPIRYCVALLLFFSTAARAQLDALPHIAVVITDSQQAAKTGPLLFTSFTQSLQARVNTHRDTVPACAQIVDPLKPWPPIWYISSFNGDVYVPQVQSGLLTVYTRHVPPLRDSTFDMAKIPADPKLFIAKGPLVVDTVNKEKSKLPFDHHDHSVSEKGEKLLIVYFDTILDMRSLTHKATDTAVLTRIDGFEILDKKDSIIFKWDPLQHIPLDERYLNYSKATVWLSPKEFDWNHANSLKWADDGNIIYSFCYIGVGKVNRSTGELMWQLGTLKNGIHLDDSVSFFAQHNFSQIRSGPYKGMYSVLSNGNDGHPCFTANVYSIDEKNLTASLVHRYTIDGDKKSNGGGNYIWVNGIQFICYGFYASETNQNGPLSIYACSVDSTDNILARYYLPAGLLVYVAYPLALSGWQKALPERPIIKEKGNHLFVRSNGAGPVTWYEMKNGNCFKITEGKSFDPANEGTYIVSQQVALGNMVSEPYVYKR